MLQLIRRMGTLFCSKFEEVSPCIGEVFPQRRMKIQPSLEVRFYFDILTRKAVFEVRFRLSVPAG